MNICVSASSVSSVGSITERTTPVIAVCRNLLLNTIEQYKGMTRKVTQEVILTLIYFFCQKK